MIFRRVSSARARKRRLTISSCFTRPIYQPELICQGLRGLRGRRLLTGVLSSGDAGLASVARARRHRRRRHRRLQRRLPPDEARLARRRAARAARAVVRHHLACGRPRRAAALQPQPHAPGAATAPSSTSTLEAETGQATGFRRSGSISVARTAERLIELKRGASMARCFGVEVEVISPAEAGRLWPLMRTDDLAGRRVDPGRRADESRSTRRWRWREGARKGGATILENVTVTGIRARAAARATGVSTDQGDIACDVVVNCAGMWGREVGRMAGVNVPLHASEHFYIVTEPMAGRRRASCPCSATPTATSTCARRSAGCSWAASSRWPSPGGWTGIPADFKFSLLPEDWEHFRLLMEQACVRIPALETAPVRQHVNGPESFTPDNRYMLGEAPELRSFFVAAGFNSVGIASAAGAGQALAEWIVGGEPSMDLWDVDIRRFMPFQGNARYLHERTTRGGRPPLRDALAVPPARDRARRALLGAARSARRARRRLRRGRRLGARELVRDRRRRAALRLHLRAPELVSVRRRRAPRGAGGRRALRPVLARQVPAPGPGRRARRCSACAPTTSTCPPGRIVYTQMLNARGGIECDLTVTRLAEDAYLVVTIAAAATHDADWIRRGIGDARVTLTDVTSALHRARRDGPALARAAVAPDATPTCRTRRSRSAPRARSRSATRWSGPRASPTSASWAGSCTCPASSRRASTTRSSPPARTFGLRHAGYHAMDSLRMEKGYRSWGHDIGERRHAARGRARLRRRLRQARLRRARGAAAPARQAARPPARDASCSTTPSRCCSATSRSSATARSSAGSPPAPTATRSGARWAWATSRIRTASTPPSSGAGAGSWSSRRSASRPPRDSSRRTIRPPRACARSRLRKKAHPLRWRSSAARGVATGRRELAYGSGEGEEAGGRPRPG